MHFLAFDFMHFVHISLTIISRGRTWAISHDMCLRCVETRDIIYGGRELRGKVNACSSDRATGGRCGRTGMLYYPAGDAVAGGRAAAGHTNSIILCDSTYCHVMSPLWTTGGVDTDL